MILLISLGWVLPYCDPSSACLGLGTRVDDELSPLNVVEDCANTGAHAAPLSRGEVYAVTGTAFASAHMNAISSRAIAVTATLGCLPLAVRRLDRLQRRT